MATQTELQILNLFLIESYSSGQIDVILTKYNQPLKLGKAYDMSCISIETWARTLLKVRAIFNSLRYAITVWYFDAKEKHEAQACKNLQQL